MIENDPNAPHQAIIFIQMEIHSLRPDGACSGYIVPHDTLYQHGLKSSEVITINGKDQQQCLERVKEIKDGIIKTRHSFESSI